VKENMKTIYNKFTFNEEGGDEKGAFLTDFLQIRGILKDPYNC